VKNEKVAAVAEKLEKTAAIEEIAAELEQWKRGDGLTGQESLPFPLAIG